MDQQLRELCEKYGLTVISTMFDRDGKVTVFPHWDDEDGADCCVSGHGKTFEEAFDAALDRMAASRTAEAA